MSRPRLRSAGAWLREHAASSSRSPSGIGSCMAARDYDRPVLVDAARARRSRTLRLAGAASPAEQPRADPRRCWPVSPTLPQVACFDTAFHRGHDALADHYAIPERFYAEGVRRYGFHGLSYEFVAEPAAAGGARRSRPGA